MRTEHYIIGWNKLAENDCEKSVKDISHNSANIFIVRTFCCILGILFSFQTSFSQNFHEAINGRNITPKNFKTLPIFERLYLLTTIEKDSAKMNAFLEPLSVIDFDSLLTMSNSFIAESKEIARKYPSSAEMINSRILLYQSVNKTLEKNRSGKIIKEQHVSSNLVATAKLDASEIQFLKGKLEDKIGSLAFMVNLDPLFDKFYALLTATEKDSSIIAADNLIYRTQWLGEKLNHSQKDIDKELKYYVDLKNKLKKKQAKK